MENQEQVLKNMVLAQWTGSMNRITKALDALSDDALLLEVAPGANQAAWLVAHIAVANASMFKLYGVTAQTRDEAIETAFSGIAAVATADLPSAQSIRAYWKGTTAELTALFESMSWPEFLHKHTAVSEEDFLKEPHRNKLNVLLGRIGHAAHHGGQLSLLAARLSKSVSAA